jgi:hypothetical protein
VKAQKTRSALPFRIACERGFMDGAKKSAVEVSVRDGYEPVIVPGEDERGRIRDCPRAKFSGFNKESSYSFPYYPVIEKTALVYAPARLFYLRVCGYNIFALCQFEVTGLKLKLFKLSLSCGTQIGAAYREGLFKMVNLPISTVMSNLRSSSGELRDGL